MKPAFRCWILEEVKGKVIQRFPSKDRKDATFPEGLELVSAMNFRWKPVGVMSTSECCLCPCNIVTPLREFSVGNPCSFCNTRTPLQGCRVIPLVINKGSKRGFCWKTTIKLVLFRSLVTDRMMFRQSLTMHGWNLQQVFVQQTVQDWNFFFFHHVTGEGFNFNFVVTMKRIISLYRWSSILFELALDAPLKIDRILLSSFQLVCWTMLTFLQLVLNLLLAAEFGLSSKNIIPFLTVSQLFVEFNVLRWIILMFYLKPY